MAKHPKSRRVRSHTGKPRRRGEVGEANRAAAVMKSPEEEVKRLVVACKALSEAPPGQFDPEEAMRLKLELDALILDIQCINEATDTQHFDWLEANVSELFDIKGRPRWIASEKVMSQDEALLKSFEQTLNRNVAANAGKKHRASHKTYADLADKSGDDDQDTVKQRVMRARRRRKALQETMQDILSIATLGKTGSAKEYKKREEKLLEAFRRILRTR
jgi:hypothetical protein